MFLWNGVQQKLQFPIFPDFLSTLDCKIKPPANHHQKKKKLSIAYTPVRSWAVPVQFLDFLAGLESAGPTFLQVDNSVQVRLQGEDEGERLDEK